MEQQRQSYIKIYSSRNVSKVMQKMLPSLPLRRYNCQGNPCWDWPISILPRFLYQYLVGTERSYFSSFGLDTLQNTPLRFWSELLLILKLLDIKIGESARIWNSPRIIKPLGRCIIWLILSLKSGMWNGITFESKRNQTLKLPTAKFPDCPETP